MSDEAPTIYFCNEVICLASYRDVFFELWSKQGTAEHAQALYDAHTSFVRAHAGKKTSCMSIVRIDELRNIDRRIIEISEKRSQTVAHDIAGWVTVVPPDGFSAVMVRSILAGLSLFRRPPHASKICSDLDEACTFILPHLARTAPGPTSARELRRALDAAMSS